MNAIDVHTHIVPEQFPVHRQELGCALAVDGAGACLP